MTRCWSKHVEIGDQVYSVNDPRHVGRIVMITWSHTATVRWNDSGWISDEKMENLRRYVERRSADGE